MEDKPRTWDNPELQAQWDSLTEAARKDIRQAVFRGRMVSDPTTAPLALVMARNLKRPNRTLTWILIGMFGWIFLFVRPTLSFLVWLTLIPGLLMLLHAAVRWNNAVRAEALHASLIPDAGRFKAELSVAQGPVPAIPRNEGVLEEKMEMLSFGKQEHLQRIARRGLVAGNPDDARLVVALSLREQRASLFYGILSFLFGFGIGLLLLNETNRSEMQWGIALAGVFGFVVPISAIVNYRLAKRAELLNASLADAIAGVDYRVQPLKIKVVKIIASIACGIAFLVLMILFARWTSDSGPRLVLFFAVFLVCIGVAVALVEHWDYRRKDKEIPWSKAMQKGGIGMLVMAGIFGIVFAIIALVYDPPPSCIDERGTPTNNGTQRICNPPAGDEGPPVVIVR